MNLPFTLPDWLPAWAFLLLALPALLYLFAFLLMPFGVFGVKARLEAIENQLEAVQEELRGLARRSSGLGPPGGLEQAYDVPDFGQLKSARAQAPAAKTGYVPPAPPIAPEPLSPLADWRERTPEERPAARAAAAKPAARPRRTEPRLD